MQVLALNVFFSVTWLVFWTYWFSNALLNKHSTTKLPTSTYYRFAVAFVLSLCTMFHLPFESVHIGVLQIVGVFFFTCGLLLAVWSRIHMGKSWGPSGTKANGALITDGPYGYIRHPIYSGILWAVLGTALATSWAWMILAVILARFMYKRVIREEGILSTERPYAHKAYRATTVMFPPIIW